MTLVKENAGDIWEMFLARTWQPDYSTETQKEYSKYFREFQQTSFA
jgi:hypothetical protein